ncbi:expressed unknown protein [Seminavis robusta]|uniref:Uncharacterized protein n=1 Tax=Seminavis robusta TaxID=568900 RepID=A0A9N8E0G7_9STRA|nr:expressed unknown protein [Seminavis robusta]|eukprot:Sro526_g160370.1 n/a (104) ;mRNA; r:24718-25029
MKLENNDNGNTTSGNSSPRVGEHPTILEAARLSIRDVQVPLPQRTGGGVSKDNLMSIIQRTLELVEAELEDDDDLFNASTTIPSLPMPPPRNHFQGRFHQMGQ